MQRKQQASMTALRELAIVDAGDDEPASESAKTELTVDQIIEEHVGSIGLGQIIHVLLLSVVRLFEAQQLMVTVFSDAQPSWRCKPASASSSYCTARSSLCSLDRGEWEWVGGSKSTTIAEWDLICERKFMAGIPAMSFFIDSLFGSVVQGWLADNYFGRKKTIVFSCLLISLTAFLTSFSPNLWVYAALRFANGFARTGISICCLVLSAESVGSRWRNQVGPFGYFLLTLGSLSVPLIAYPSRHSWRTLYRLISLPPLLHFLLLLTPLVAESPRWLAVRGRHHQAINVLSRFAKLNGRKLPDNITISHIAVSNTVGGRARSLWSFGWAVRRLMTTMAAGLGIGFINYGLQLNLNNLRPSLYLSVTVNGLAEIPAVFLGGVLIGLMNRRILFSTLAFTAGASCLVCAFVGEKKQGMMRWLQMIVEAIGFMAASLAFHVVLVFCLELFPTNVRNTAMSMLRVALMLGGVLSPVLVAAGRVSPALPFIVFGGFGMLSSFMMIWLPETRNAPLYETLEQQEEDYKLKSRAAVEKGPALG